MARGASLQSRCRSRFVKGQGDGPCSLKSQGSLINIRFWTEGKNERKIAWERQLEEGGPKAPRQKSAEVFSKRYGLVMGVGNVRKSAGCLPSEPIGYARLGLALAGVELRRCPATTTAIKSLAR